MIRHALLIVIVGLFFNNLTLAQELEVDATAVKRLVSRWNDAHTISTVETLSSLYADPVRFYGSTLKRSRCITIKRAALEKQNGFSQVLMSDLHLMGYVSGAIRCDFVKTVIRNEKATDYNAYLIIKRIGEIYFIIAESDLTTDRNIKNKPDLGTKIAIRDVKYDPVPEANPVNAITTDSRKSGVADFLLLGGALAVGFAGLVIAFRKMTPTGFAGLAMAFQRAKTSIFKRSKPVDKAAQRNDFYEKGMAFEKYVVKRFAEQKKNFTLMEWRSDKFHEGIFPESNRHPDLVYRFRMHNFVRTFSVECKYRSRANKGLISLMNEEKYRIYEAFHKNNMPVYIALGLGGTPRHPAQLYVIPFQDVRLEMSPRELRQYWDRRTFFYDIDFDRLV